MSSSFGKAVQISIFGASHGTAIGAVIDGLPCGHHVDLEELQSFLSRRAPGQNLYGTQRKETDEPIFLSGIVNGVLTGSPLAFYIKNKDHHSSDYDNLRDIPRPSHADYTAVLRYGKSVDMRGGGHFSARLTAPLCVAGGIALQLLRQVGVTIGAHLTQVGELVAGSVDPLNPPMEEIAKVAKESVPMLPAHMRRQVGNLLESLRMDCDSTGGVVEVLATGFPAGIGNPIYDAIESRLAQVGFSLPGVKGIEFGCGFAGSKSRGSVVNDPFTLTESGTISTMANNSGGIQGGISNGQPIVMRLAFKPTASIAKEQDSVSLSKGTKERLIIKGRHDPCIAIRAVPVCEAMMATILLDYLIERRQIHEI